MCLLTLGNGKDEKCIADLEVCVVSMSYGTQLCL